MTQREKRKRMVRLHNKFSPQLGEHLMGKRKQILHQFNGISTPILTCALSLLRDQKDL